MAPLMMIGSVPLYNVMAVVVLSVLHPEHKGLDRKTAKATLRGIVTNPILIGIAAGLAWSALAIPMPAIMDKTVSSLGAMATPMGLIAMGASFDPKRISGRLGPVLTATFMKLVGFAALFIPLAVFMGFREQALVAIVIMLGSASTVSGYVMARSMGHEGILSAGTVMLTTALSAFTVTFWIWLLRSLGLI